MRREGSPHHQGQVGKARGKTRHTAHHDLGHPQRTPQTVSQKPPERDEKQKPRSGSKPSGEEEKHRDAIDRPGKKASAAEFAFVDSSPLPEFGHDTFVLTRRNLTELFAYWEISPARLIAGEAKKRAGEEYAEVIRLSWPPASLFAVNFSFFPIAFHTRRSALRVPFEGLAYQAEIGWLGSQGDFIPVLASNRSDAAARPFPFQLAGSSQFVFL